ncbi:uncharacterized protein KIAA0754-like isoform X2 [Thrips palmi]|uniref:Uncharacterized protein KIAA0754-like isoform X2 n=1 Tax=Thrips palmi TaxID=161013 RepID=A0A6P8YXL5_THRPL|nr:uncharacterized protein KIAA0754-like isoform X2 [Thrips palmi]
MDAQRQLHWAVALAALVVCGAVPAQREVFYNQPYPAFYSPQYQAYQPQQYQPFQAYQQPLQVRSAVPAVPQYQQYQQQQFPQYPYQRVLVYNPAAGQVGQVGQAAYPQHLPAGVYNLPAGSFLPLPLRAEGETGGSTGGFPWGNPSEYLTVLQNYWQNFSTTGTFSGKPPAEAAGANPTPAESPAEPTAPSASSEGAKKPEAPAMPAAPEMPAAAPAMTETPVSTAQRFLVVSQPQVVANPAALPSASNGAVSTYLLLRNEPFYGFSAPQQQEPNLRVQPGQPQQQTVLPSASGPMILVRTADNKYGLAAASNPTQVIVSGEGIRARDDVQVSGPGSQGLAFQRFLVARQGQQAPGFYPAPHPGVVHSLTDESIAVEALRDATNSSEAETPAPAATTAAPTANNDEEVVDSDEKPVSIAQVKPQAIALAGPGGVAAAAPVGTALVGPGGMALSAPTATAVAGPAGGTPPIAVPSANTAAHNADAFRKWLSKKKPATAAASDDVLVDARVDAPIMPELLVEYGAAA